MSDEKCLEVALSLRASLDYLLPALHQQLSAAREYEAALAKTRRRRNESAGPQG